MKILTSLITAIVTIFHPAGVDLNMLSATYRSSQYCLTDYRAQHRIDQLLPEYGRECDANPSSWATSTIPSSILLPESATLEGKSPASLNWESQPLTKYLFGLSSALFGTPLPIQFVLALLTLIVLYYLARSLLPPYLSLIPPILLALDPLFRDQLVRPYLDLSVTFFALLWLLYLGQRDRAKWYLGGIILGALALSKSFSLGILAAVLGLITAPRAYLLSQLQSSLISLAILCFLLLVTPSSIFSLSTSILCGSTAHTYLSTPKAKYFVSSQLGSGALGGVTRDSFLPRFTRHSGPSAWFRLSISPSAAKYASTMSSFSTWSGSFWSWVSLVCV